MEIGPAHGQEEWGRCRCELSWPHDGDHAIFVCDADGAAGRADELVWAFWNDHAGVLAVRIRTDCGTYDASKEDCCTLYQDHPGHHSFEILDPVEVALLAMGDQIRMGRFGPQTTESLPPL
ncbi:hypothetical protein ACWC0A_29835 [Streptomyces scopuliridis]